MEFTQEQFKIYMIADLFKFIKERSDASTEYVLDKAGECYDKIVKEANKR